MTLLSRLRMTAPIFQAPMAGVTTPALAAAVSNAGGLGGLGLGTAGVDAARKAITETQKLTSRAFNVNLFVHQTPSDTELKTETTFLDALKPMHDEVKMEGPAKLPAPGLSFLDDQALLELLLDLKPPVISFHFGLPPAETLRRFKDLGIILMASATSLAELRAIEEAGLDVVIAQGEEAGGHRGIFDPNGPDERISTIDLVRLFAKHTKLPIIAAGGIMDGHDINIFLEAGATAAQLGTAFIPCPESTADDAYRQALSNSVPGDTVFTKLVSGRPARGLRNKYTELEEKMDGGKLPDFPVGYTVTKALSAHAKKAGVKGFEVRWAGTQASRSRTMPAAELVSVLTKEMEQDRIQ
jgi:nitronate monooxygenase